MRPAQGLSSHTWGFMYLNPLRGTSNIEMLQLCSISIELFGRDFMRRKKKYIYFMRRNKVDTSIAMNVAKDHLPLPCGLHSTKGLKTQSCSFSIFMFTLKMLFTYPFDNKTFDLLFNLTLT